MHQLLHHHVVRFVLQIDSSPTDSQERTQAEDSETLCIFRAQRDAEYVEQPWAFLVVVKILMVRTVQDAGNSTIIVLRSRISCLSSEMPRVDSAAR